MAGQVPRGWSGGVEGQAGPGQAAEAERDQLRRLYTLIVGSDPRQLQLEVALWTRDLVRELIRREFDVRRSAVSVGRLLTKLGLSPQRPL